jgi:hypothetical protein
MKTSETSRGWLSHILRVFLSDFSAILSDFAAIPHEKGVILFPQYNISRGNKKPGVFTLLLCFVG